MSSRCKCISEKSKRTERGKGKNGKVLDEKGKSWESVVHGRGFLAYVHLR